MADLRVDLNSAISWRQVVDLNSNRQSPEYYKRTDSSNVIATP